MKFKNIYKDNSLVSKTGILFLLIITSFILHVILVVFLIMLFDSNGMYLIQNQDLNNQICVNYLKLVQLFAAVGLFITPTLLYAYLTGFNFKFISITIKEVLLTILVMIFITPFVGLLLEWNMQISFPEWLSLFDKNSTEIVTAFLSMQTIWDLFYTLLVIAVVPAIGEELVFRGYLQQTIQKYLQYSHFAILITALFFSVIHLEIQAIIPRFILGVLLGYLYYWSGSLWLPILGHFVNNAQAIIFSYPFFGLEESTYFAFSKSTPNPVIGLFSFISAGFLIYILYKTLRLRKVKTGS